MLTLGPQDLRIWAANYICILAARALLLVQWVVRHQPVASDVHVDIGSLNNEETKMMNRNVDDRIGGWRLGIAGGLWLQSAQPDGWRRRGRCRKALSN